MWELDYKAKCRRLDVFELWYWRRLLRVSWTARRSNQSILKEISPEYSLERLMLKLQYFGHLMWRTQSLKRPWCWKRLKEGGEGDDRGWDGWMASLTQRSWVWTCQVNGHVSGHEFEQTKGDSEGQRSLACCSPLGHKALDTTEQLNWTELVYVAH